MKVRVSLCNHSDKSIMSKVRGQGLNDSGKKQLLRTKGHSFLLKYII